MKKRTVGLVAEGGAEVASGAAGIVGVKTVKTAKASARKASKKPVKIAKKRVATPVKGVKGGRGEAAPVRKGEPDSVRVARVEGEGLTRGQALEQLEQVLLEKALSGDIQAAKLLYSRWGEAVCSSGAESDFTGDHRLGAPVLDGSFAGSGGPRSLKGEAPSAVFSAAYEQELDERIRALMEEISGLEGVSIFGSK